MFYSRVCRFYNAALFSFLSFNFAKLILSKYHSLWYDFYFGKFMLFCRLYKLLPERLSSYPPDHFIFLRSSWTLNISRPGLWHLSNSPDHRNSGVWMGTVTFLPNNHNRRFIHSTQWMSVFPRSEVSLTFNEIWQFSIFPKFSSWFVVFTMSLNRRPELHFVIINEFSWFKGENLILRHLQINSFLLSSNMELERTGNNSAMLTASFYSIMVANHLLYYITDANPLVW